MSTSSFSLTSRLLVFLFVLILLNPSSAALAAPASLSISGRVTDPQGALVPDADLKLFAGSSGPTVSALRTTRSDAEGRYTFAGVAPGEYRVAISKPGFETQYRAVTLQGASAEEDFSLALAGQFEGVVVTATRQPGETTGTVLPAALVTSQVTQRSLSQNVARALEDVPGVSTVGTGSFRTRPILRGLDSNRILVLVDGERLNNARTATNFGGIETSIVDLSQIDQIEVVRGPGSVLYGSDAFGGVINLITRGPQPADDLYFGARLNSERYNNSNMLRGAADIFAGARKWSLRTGGSLGNAGDYTSPLGRVFFSGGQENSGYAEGRVYPAARQSLFLKFSYRGAYDVGFPDLSPAPSFLANFPFTKLRKFGWGYSGNFSSPALTALQLRFYRQEQRRDFFNLISAPGFSQSSETVTDITTNGYDLQATSLLMRKHVLTYGSSLYSDFNQDTRTQIVFPGTLNIVTSRAPSVPNSRLSGLGFFLQDQFEAGRRLRLVAGIRVDRFDLSVRPTPNFDPSAQAASSGRNDTAWSGNLGATVLLTEGWVLTGNVARAFREPNLFERYFFGRGSVGGFIVPNPALSPETSVQFDAGTRFTHGKLRLSANYFLNQLHDLISNVPGTFNGQTVFGGQPVYVNVNIDRARIQGIESTAETTWRAGGVDWSPFVSLAWLRGTNLTSSTPLPQIAPFTSSAGLRFQPRQCGAWVEGRARFVKGGDRVPPGNPPLSGYSTFAVRWGYELDRNERWLGSHLPRGVAGVNLHFAFENVSDKLYRNLFDIVPEPGRGFRFGVDFTLDSRAK